MDFQGADAAVHGGHVPFRDSVLVSELQTDQGIRLNSRGYEGIMTGIL